MAFIRFKLKGPPPPVIDAWSLARDAAVLLGEHNEESEKRTGNEKERKKKGTIFFLFFFSFFSTSAFFFLVCVSISFSRSLCTSNQITTTRSVHDSRSRAPLHASHVGVRGENSSWRELRKKKKSIFFVDSFFALPPRKNDRHAEHERKKG